LPPNNVSENPFGKGKPVDENIVLEAMKAQEADRDSKFDNDHKTFIEGSILQQKIREKFLEGFNKLGISFEDEIGQLEKFNPKNNLSQK
jgi:hypothetical protein